MYCRGLVSVHADMSDDLSLYIVSASKSDSPFLDRFSERSAFNIFPNCHVHLPAGPAVLDQRRLVYVYSPFRLITWRRGLSCQRFSY